MHDDLPIRQCTNTAALLPAAGVYCGDAIFPTVRQIPAQCMDPVARNLLQYLPAPTSQTAVYQGVPTEADNQDQFTVRVDHKINDRQNLSIYYYFTDGNTHSPFYNFQARERTSRATDDR